MDAILLRSFKYKDSKSEWYLINAVLHDDGSIEADEAYKLDNLNPEFDGHSHFIKEWNSLVVWINNEI